MPKSTKQVIGKRTRGPGVSGGKAKRSRVETKTKLTKHVEAAEDSHVELGQATAEPSSDDGEGEPEKEIEPVFIEPPVELRPEGQSFDSFYLAFPTHSLWPSDYVDVTALLRSALVQSIRTTLSLHPRSAFPISPSTFYTSYILPSRPAYILPPSPVYTPYSCTSPSASPSNHIPIDIPHSTHKSLSSFLRTMANEGLIRLKDKKPDAKIIGVCKPEEHSDVRLHKRFKTVGEVAGEEESKAKEVVEENSKTDMERKMVVQAFWQPRGSVVSWFENQGLE